MLNHSTLVDLLRYRAERQPAQVGYTFLEDGETKAVELTYLTLDEQARAIAARLQKLKLQGERALLLYHPGLEFIAAFFGCLYAGVIATPAYPPRRHQKLDRLRAIVTDARSEAILTTQSLLATIENSWEQHLKVAALTWVATDNIAIGTALDWQEPEINSNTLAFLQYTSGSTGKPKGTMLAHSNLLDNQQIIQKAFEHTADTTFVGWLPLFHDMGLVGNILQPLYLGIPCVLMSPVAFLQKPLRWLQAISCYRATTSGAPNFAYDLCVQKIAPEQRTSLDLSSWDVAFTGAEPIRAETLKQFAEYFSICGFRFKVFYPCYGLAETTLIVSGGLKSAPPIIETVDSAALEQNRVVTIAPESPEARQIVGCGQIRPGYQVAIAEPKTLTCCSEEQVGEIWVAGASVAQGYWNQPELTQETFSAYLADTGEGPFLRTGDLGFIRNGELFVTGRIKDVIIIRGRNYYPQDIEQTVEQSHPALRANCSAAFTVEEGKQKLIVASEIERLYLRKLNPQEVIETIRRAISQHHELQVYAVLLLKPGTIPKTSSGKIQRHVCRKGYQENTLNAIATGEAAELPSIPVNGERATMNEKTNDLIGWLRSYANEQINSRLIDERRCIPPYIVLDFGNQGLLGMQVPPKYGGIGLGSYDTMRVIEQLGAIDLTLALFVGLNNILGIRPLLKFGGHKLREDLLPLLATGRELAAFALTEPGAGSNPQAILSKAIATGNHSWLLQGTKIWSGSAAWAGAINVFVQQQDTEGKLKGISGFVVRKGSRGLKQGTEALTMGMRGMVQNTVYLEDVPVASEQLLGEEGTGMAVAQDAMMYGRLAIAAASVGGMKRCAQLMLRYSSRRSIATGRLLDNPLVLTRLNSLTAAIAAVEILVRRIAQLLDRGRVIPVEAYAACKITGPEFYWQAADNLVQLLGGRGYIETNLAPQILRDARVLRIFEGPTETLTLFLGSRVINESEELKVFICRDLEAPEVYQNLMAAANKISDRYTGSHSPFPDRVSSLRWASSLLGEIAAFAILLAAVQYERAKFAFLPAEGGHSQAPAFQAAASSPGLSKPGECRRGERVTLQRTSDWLKLNFEQKLAQALSVTPEEAVLSSAEQTAEAIASYTETIGDLEQTLAGEEWGLDELLRKGSRGAGETVRNSASHAEFKTHRKGSRGAGEQGSKGARELFSSRNIPVKMVEVIQDWLAQWLGRKLKISPKTIDLRKSFADYGIDSVMAVELAQDLEEWLGYPKKLEATIAWNFPNIESLAFYLSQNFTSASTNVPTQMDEPDKVDSLSEAEIAQLLAQEIAEARRANP